MRKIILVFALLSVLAPLSAKKRPAPVVVEEPLLVSGADSAVYSLGVTISAQLADNLRQLFGENFNRKAFLQAMETSLYERDSALLISAGEATLFLDNYMLRMQQEIMTQNQQEGEKFLAENRQREGVQETASGLQYQVVREGNGPKPALTDRVKVHYEGFLLSGEKFDSSVDRGEPAVFPLNQVIAGWTEGLQLMPVGSKYTLYIPYQLAYGDKGAGRVIPPYATLIFEVELLGIE
ncbi:MAG: FKBP-type peptidyl-prolyl cis-trans isomerase [Paludibacteraceae bacterium]|nr:FKBP-type peptidyl-prolyl cis-trans isomerase [Paludibacteraceae bacterium]